MAKTKKNNVEKCYLSSQHLPIDILALICEHLRIGDILTLSNASILLKDRIKNNNNRCWNKHLQTLRQICLSVEHVLKRIPSFYDILKGIEELFLKSKTITQLEKTKEPFFIPFILNLYYPGGKHFNYFGFDVSQKSYKFIDHCNHMITIKRDFKTRHYKFSSDFYESYIEISLSNLYSAFNFLKTI
jgi:hypothetical protein